MRGLVVIGSFLGIATCSFAQVSAVVTIPTADVVGIGELSLTQSLSVKEGKLNDQYYNGTEIQCGLIENAEFAIRTNYSGRTDFGLKYVPYRSKDGKFSLGLGMSEFDGVSNSWFVMSRFAVGKTNYHLGLVDDSDSRFAFGVTHSIGKTWVFSADYLSNGDGQSSYGILYNIRKGLGIGFTHSEPNGYGKSKQSLKLKYKVRF